MEIIVIENLHTFFWNGKCVNLRLLLFSMNHNCGVLQILDTSYRNIEVCFKINPVGSPKMERGRHTKTLRQNWSSSIQSQCRRYFTEELPKEARLAVAGLEDNKTTLSDRVDSHWNESHGNPKRGNGSRYRQRNYFLVREKQNPRRPRTGLLT
jgi:hypothetical protein